ncbi:MAG: serine/threonine protein kinase [Planctomycetes bacterium]|nr:serine/threonine protein kinase [Planctomycetota bacterium]
MRDLGACVLALAASLAAAGEDWPQFRGPGGDGLSRSANPPLDWSESKNIAWKAAVPGRGRSSPVLLGGRIWLTTAVEQGVVRKRIAGEDMAAADHVALGAACLDRATGKLLWHVTIFDLPKPAPVHWLNSWATPTPVVEPGRLYCDFGAMGTACLDAETGKPLWTQRFPIDHMVGPGSSPLLYRDLLVLVRDGCEQQYVIALDKKTGETAWKAPRPPIDSPAHMRKAYSTPLLIEAGGATQMVAVGARWAVSYDPATGKELWRVRHGNGWSLAPRPVAGNGLVCICTGAMVPQLWAIRLDGQGDVTKSHVAWKFAEVPFPLMSSPILVGKELYSANDEGVVLCLDALTGQTLWRTRLGGPAMAAPVHAAGRVYFWTRDGKGIVFKAGRQLDKLAESQLDGTVVASPAIVADAIYLRTDTHLYRIEAR